MFFLLRLLHRVRGTFLDPFGYARVRRVERQLHQDYVSSVDRALLVLEPGNQHLALRLAELPDVIRGFEEVKLANVDRYYEEAEALLAELDTAGRSSDLPRRHGRTPKWNASTSSRPLNQPPASAPCSPDRRA